MFYELASHSVLLKMTRVIYILGSTAVSEPVLLLVISVAIQASIRTVDKTA